MAGRGHTQRNCSYLEHPCEGGALRGDGEGTPGDKVSVQGWGGGGRGVNEGCG